MSFAKFVQTVSLLLGGFLAVVNATRAFTQSETVLYNFTDVGGDGRAPQNGLTSDDHGNFYGNTSFGGAPGSNGTVFELSPNGSGGWNETVLYSFTGKPDGAYPNGPFVIDSAGNLYGSTTFGGVYDKGTVFELSHHGALWTETVPHSFGAKGAKDSQLPLSGLIMDSSGNLFGTTAGAVFEVSPSGGKWTAKAIYYGVDDIFSGLTMDAAGNIYGASISRAFELSPNGKGGWHKHVIHIFAGGPTDGTYVTGTPALDQAGNLYGTTALGGLGGGNGNGMVYELSPAQNGTWTEKILYFFKGGKDAYNPSSGGVVLDAAGNIYGNTYNVASTALELYSR